MEWGAIFLTIVGLIATIKLYAFYRIQKSLKFLGLTLAALVLSLTQISIVAEEILSAYNLTIYSSYIVEWGHVVVLALVLSALTIFIRESKPAFAQFPLLYSALPLFIVFSYVLVTDTYAIKEWLLSIYQGGAVLVAILMYSVYTYRNSNYLTVLSGAILFLVTFILFWYVPEVRETYHWLWKLLFAGGILVYIQGLDKVIAAGK